MTGQRAGVFVPLQSATLLVLMKDSMTSRSGHDGPGQLISLYLYPAMTLIPTALYVTTASFADINCIFVSQTKAEVKDYAYGYHRISQERLVCPHNLQGSGVDADSEQHFCCLLW